MAQLEMYRSVFEKSGGEPGCTASDQNLIPADASHPGPVEQKGAQPRPAPGRKPTYTGLPSFALPLCPICPPRIRNCLPAGAGLLTWWRRRAQRAPARQGAACRPPPEFARCPPLCPAPARFRRQLTRRLGGLAFWRPNMAGPDGLARRRRALEAVQKIVTAPKGYEGLRKAAKSDMRALLCTSAGATLGRPENEVLRRALRRWAFKPSAA
jgi:hypothetical protein